MAWAGIHPAHVKKFHLPNLSLISRNLQTNPMTIPITIKHIRFFLTIPITTKHMRFSITFTGPVSSEAYFAHLINNIDTWEGSSKPSLEFSFLRLPLPSRIYEHEFKNLKKLKLKYINFYLLLLLFIY